MSAVHCETCTCEPPTPEPRREPPARPHRPVAPPTPRAEIERIRQGSVKVDGIRSWYAQTLETRLVVGRHRGGEVVQTFGDCTIENLRVVVLDRLGRAADLERAASRYQRVAVALSQAGVTHVRDLEPERLAAVMAEPKISDRGQEHVDGRVPHAAVGSSVRVQSELETHTRNATDNPGSQP